MEKYESSHFQANWSKVGVFKIVGMQQGEERYHLMNRKEVRGKGAVNGDTLLTYTKDMWLV